MPSNNGKIKFSVGKTVVLQTEQTRVMDSVTIQRIVCIPDQRIIRAFVQEIGRPIVIYKDAEYDALKGNISMQDIETRVKEELGITD